MILESIEGLTEEQASRTMASGKWSIKDVLAHIIGWDEECTRAIQKAIDEEQKPGFLDWKKEDMDAFNRKQVQERKQRTFKELVEELKQTEGEWNRQTGRLTDEEIDRHPGWWKWMEDAGHDIQHAKQIMEARKKAGV